MEGEKSHSAPNDGVANGCTYCDFAGVKSSAQETLSDSFPVKLHYMLADVEKDGFEDIVSWSSHGRYVSK